MKTLLSILALLCGTAAAQTVSVYPATVTSPIGGYPTCTAQVVGQNDKTVTWSATSGVTIVGTNPSTLNEPATVAVTTLTPGTYTLTATTNTGALTAHCTATFTASPTPVTTHPRLGGMTAANLAAMQAKAITGNTLYNSGIRANAIALYTTDNTEWNWSCGGGAANTKTGQPTSDQSQSYVLGGNLEGNAWAFAFMALVDPSDPTYNWGCYARDIWNYYQNYWLSPDNSQYTSTTAPYRATDENYGVTGNHGSDNTTFLTMTPDWLLGAGWLGAGSGAILTATESGGTINLPTITSGGSGYLANANVYWYAYGGGCATQGHYGNFESTGISGNNGIPYVAMGVVQTNGSGVVAGTVTQLTTSSGCTSAPSVVVYSDQNTARSYLTMAGSMTINIAYTGVRAQVGSYNSSGQFNIGSIYAFTGQRAMGNNYTHSKMMYLTAAALTFNNNTTDDPTLAQTSNTNTCNGARGTVCSDGSVANMHAFFTYLTGGMELKDYAHLEDPNVTQQAYNTAYPSGGFSTQTTCEDETNTTNTPLIVPCFGDGRQGQSVEGTSYGYSFYRLAEALLSIHSAGYDDPTLYGPQISLGVSSFFDLHINANLEFLSYTSVASQPRYSTFFVGDIFNFPYPATFEDSAWWMVYDASVGRTDRTATEEWPLVATSVGGTTDFYGNLANSYGGEIAIPMFIALPSGDPSTSYPSDPRPTLPTVTYEGNNQSIFARSAWDTTGPVSPSNTGSPPASTQQVFFSRCANTRVDHEPGDCGRFDILSNAEYITKARAIAPEYNYYFSSAEHANYFGLGANQAQTACLPNAGEQFIAPLCQGMQNYSTQSYTLNSIVYYGSGYWQCTGSPCLSTDVPGTAGDWTSVPATATRGAGQIFHALQAGNATLHHSEMPNYIAFDVDQTTLYCVTAVAASGVGSISPCPTAASRSLLYIRGAKQIAWEDRGAGASNSRDWVNTTGAITISGNTASWLTQSGTQKALVTSLLLGVTMSDAGGYLTINNGDPSTPDWEAYSHLLEDLGTPSSAQVLNGLQWGASGGSFTPASLVQSTAGQGVDCSVMTANMVCFLRAWPATFTGTTVTVTGAVTTTYIADTAPNTTYTVTGTGCTSPNVTSDNAGVLVLSSCLGSTVIGSGGTPTAATPTFSPVAGTYTGPQSVAISTTSSGAIICYNTTGSPATNGSTGCTTGTLYTGPVTVNVSETLYAVAGGTGYVDSSVASAVYVITSPQAATPTFSPVAGPYVGSQSVTLFTSTSGCGSYIVWNTTGAQSGGNLTGTSSTNPLTVAVSETVYAQVQACPTYSNSNIGSALYTIGVPAGRVTLTGDANLTGKSQPE